jgi:hypothetical protein
MTFNLTLTPQVLTSLTKKLSGLATDVQYKPGELNIGNFDPANEPAIVELIASNTKAADLPSAEELEPINWIDLAREAEKAKRRAALEAHQDLAKIQAKRRRQTAL